MITQQQFLDAAADFAGLVAAEETDVGWALVEASRAHGINPVVFEKRLTAKEDLKTIVGEIRKRAKQDAFHRAMVIETRIYWERIPERPGLGWLFNDDHRTASIKSAIAEHLGRPVDEAEENQIREHFFEIVQGRFV